jgi:hypothetical protein
MLDITYHFGRLNDLPPALPGKGRCPEIQGVKKVPCPLLSHYAPLFMLIHIYHTIKGDYANEIMIINFLRYNYRTR